MSRGRRVCRLHQHGNVTPIVVNAALGEPASRAAVACAHQLQVHPFDERTNDSSTARYPTRQPRDAHARRRLVRSRPGPAGHSAADPDRVSHPHAYRNRDRDGHRNRHGDDDGYLHNDPDAVAGSDRDGPNHVDVNRGRTRAGAVRNCGCSEGSKFRGSSGNARCDGCARRGCRSPSWCCGRSGAPAGPIWQLPGRKRPQRICPRPWRSGMPTTPARRRRWRRRTTGCRSGPRVRPWPLVGRISPRPPQVRIATIRIRCWQPAPGTMCGRCPPGSAASGRERQPVRWRASMRPTGPCTNP